MAPYVSTGVIYASPTTNANGLPDSAIAGPILVQAFMQYLFQGVIITQTVKFYERFRDDPIALRGYVFLLFLISILQTVIMSYKAWVATIEEMQWWFSPIYLIRRCWKATNGNIWVLVCLSFLALVSLVAAIILTVKIGTIFSPSLDESHPDPLHASAFAYPLWVYSSFCTSLSLTIILSRSLWKTRTGLSHLDRTVETIILLTWESAILPMICMLTSAIIFSIGGVEGTGDSIIARSHLDLFFAILTGKLYTIGILRTLNSRTLLRERLQSIPLGRQSLSRWEWAQPRENFRQSISLEGAEADEEDDTVGGESEGSRKELQPTPTTVDVTESNVLPTEGAPIVIMQPPPEHLDVIVGNGSGIDHSPSPLRSSIPIQRRMSATRDQPSPEPNQAA